MNILKRINNYIKAESKRSGQSYTKIAFEMVVNYIKYGVNPKEYYYFQFNGKTREQKKTFFTRKMFRKFLKRNNNPQFTQILNDKYIFSKTYSEFLGRKVIRSNNHLTVADLEYVLKARTN